MNEPRRALLIVLGTLFVALGVLGVLVPVLPTTPFLLLAAACYARSSDRFYRWLIYNRWCGEYVRSYREGRGIPLKQKVLTILLLWLTIGSTAWLAVSQWWVRLMLLGIALGVTIHLARIKSHAPNGRSNASHGECASGEELDSREEAGGRSSTVSEEEAKQRRS